MAIDVALTIYRSEYETLYTSLDTKRSIAKVHNYATKLFAELKKLLDDPIFFTADQPHWRSRPRPATQDFETLFEQLRKLQSTLKTAESRTRPGPGRKSVQPMDRLVEQLNWIQAEFSQDAVTHSRKKTEGNPAEFIRLCCRTVGLTDGQIDRAIKRYAARRHRNIQFQYFDLSTGEPLSEQDRVRKSRRSRPKSRGEG